MRRPAESPEGVRYPGARTPAGKPGTGSGPANPRWRPSFARFQDELGLSEGQADILTGSSGGGRFLFEAAAGRDLGRIPHALANWIVNELLRELKGRSLADLPVTPEHLAALVALLEEGVISQPVAKEIFAEMVDEGG